MGNNMGGLSSSVQSVDRAVAILEILARDGEAGVTEVARELDVHKSTASRLLAALDRRELVTQDTARGKFRLGVGIVRLAGAASARLDVVQESRPVCRALAQQVGETVSLAILSGRDALYLDQAAGPAALSPHHWAGRRIPLHATSDGKVLLAYLPEDELAASLVPPLARFTERTIAAVAEFPALLAGTVLTAAGVVLRGSVAGIVMIPGMLSLAYALLVPVDPMADSPRRRELERELAAYCTPAQRCDLEATLDRYPDGVTRELRDILAGQEAAADRGRAG